MIIDSPEEAERIVTQVVENIQRAELTEADEADAYHQLSLIGVSAAAIAKKTGRTKTTVECALKAKSSDAGAAALGKGYTIEKPLIMAEFEGDEDAIEELESVITGRTRPASATSPSSCATAANSAAALAAPDRRTGSPGQDHRGGRRTLRRRGEPRTSPRAKRADGEPATDEDANAYLISTDYRGQHNAKPVITGWKELGFTPKYERYDGGTQRRKAR